jgi:cyclophilin family peptidyl-prolyl cis-trans isomerase
MRLWYRRSLLSSRSSRSYRPQIENLEERCLLSVTITAISDKNLPAEKSLIVPLAGTDSTGAALAYSVSSSNTNVTTTILSGNTFLDLNIAPSSAQPGGHMIFELFNDLTPHTVSEITALVNKGFYNGLTFHRVVQNFVIQGGDPLGNGTGGPGFTFIDEYNSNLIYTGDGQLAMANSGPDTNGSQFFVTIGPQRFLDFNNAIFGQLISGFDVRDAIAKVPVDANDKPLTPVRITSATIISDNHDAVVLLTAKKGFSGTVTLTVTAHDAGGASASQTFHATVAADTTNDPPFLVPVSNQTTPKNTPITFSLTGVDLENDPLDFEAKIQDNPAHATATVNGNQVTVTPDAGFVGDIHVLVGVRDHGATSRGSTNDPFDTHVVTITVTNSVTNKPPATNATFITQLYQDLLGRQPEGGAVNFWTGQMNNGMSRRQVATEILHSQEGLIIQVDRLYRSLLGREADEGGLELSVLALVHGDSLQHIRSVILGSDEYFQVHASSNGNFVQAVFHDMLGRLAESGYTSMTVPLLDNHSFSRESLARAILRAPEATQDLVTNLYEQLLHRTPDSGGLQIFASDLKTPSAEDSVMTDLVSSNEYFNNT